ncbi:MAG TPA: M1 family aminopeptidase [Streptosporangiaceae bacterium]|nr:M1 family aminopeptidase [Streptosporangiaceae bacterium]
MASHRYAVAGALSFAMILAGGGSGLPGLAGTGAAHDHERCSAGAHTLAAPGSRLYPDTGNGGYTSLHTGVHMVYDATSNRFLPGNHVTLTDRATQCLTSFSLDFERGSANASAGPDMAVNSVTVDGKRAAFRFVQPTYPGDRHGQDDPDPLAHEASQLNPVGGPAHNPLPPACSPELPSTGAAPNSANGTQCPANKLVITPSAPIRRGETFSVTVAYTGRPGVHNDGDGTTEGWFRSNRPKGDGGFVTTEPVGTEDWMPLNDHPSAKPTYDFDDTVNAGRTVLANGVLVSREHHLPDSLFPHGSVTWHWHSAAPVASYLVENSVGRYDLAERTVGGIRFYQAQASSLSAARKAKNRAIMSKQPDITRFESMFTGPFPFTSDGVVVGRPSASFEEEMQNMITFAGGEIDTDTLYHENMHQWWGDHVTEASYNLTFFKEGMATFGEFLFAARRAQAQAGGPGSEAGRRAFQRSLVRRFNATYASKGRFWTAAPSNPTPHGLFSGSATYERPGIAYIALRQILGKSNYVQALREVQRRYGGGVITEAQLEAVFHRLLPTRNPACHSRLDQFFTQWFDTAYQPGGGARRPHITGPGLAGPGFYTGTCTR